MAAQDWPARDKCRLPKGMAIHRQTHLSAQPSARLSTTDGVQQAGSLDVGPPAASSQDRPSLQLNPLHHFLGQHHWLGLAVVEAPVPISVAASRPAKSATTDASVTGGGAGQHLKHLSYRRGLWCEGTRLIAHIQACCQWWGWSCISRQQCLAAHAPDCCTTATEGLLVQGPGTIVRQPASA